MVGLLEIAKNTGLNPIICDGCGHRMKSTIVLGRLFREILAKVKNGESVRIIGFGTFSAKLLRGRVLKSKMAGESAKFDDLLILKFSQSSKARRFLNGGE